MFNYSFSYYGQKVKQATNVGSNDQHIWGSREQCKRFWNQGSLSLKHVREQVVSLRRLPIAFWPRANWFRNRAMARALKRSTRKSRAMKRNEMSTNITPKFYETLCASLLQFQNIYQKNTKRCSSALNTKEKSTWSAGASINLSGRHPNDSHGAKQRSLLPHIFAAFGLVCGRNTKPPNMCPNISKNSF